MDTGLVIQQMLVLFVMMVLGFVAYKIKMLDAHSCTKLSSLIVHILNPAIIINGVLGKDSSQAGNLIAHNLILIVIMFAILIVISGPVASLLRVKKENRSLYQMMTIFSNVGFMGIPVVSSIYGPDAVIYVSFYMLIYNLLLYSLGVWLISQNSNQNAKFSFKKMLNTGVIACLISFVIFGLQIKTPVAVGTFMGYVGNAAVPMSMIVIGASMAQADLKEAFRDVKMMLYCLIKLIVIPVIMAVVVQFTSFDPLLEGVFIIMLSMPVGSIVTLLAEEYGADRTLSSRGIVMTTVLCVVTLPIVSVIQQAIVMLF